MTDCIDGAPAVQCDCKRSSHTHGERITYVIHKCRGDACKEAARLYERNRERMKLYGRANLVPAEPVRRHVRDLMAQGMGWKRVAKAAGVAPSIVGHLLYGKCEPGHPDYRPPRKQISRRNAAAILAVTYTESGGTHVDATGSRRRLQALVYVGWSQSNLARHLDLEGCTVWAIINGRRARIAKTTHDRIAGFFEAHWNTAPQDQPGEVTSRSINHAKRMRWAPAAAWDDLDDPDGKPSGVDASGVRVRESALRRLDDLEDLAGLGEGWNSLTIRRAGFASLAAAARTAHRHGRGGIVTALKRNQKGVAA